MNRTSRRRFLAGIGTASAALAAGCSSSSSSGSGDSADDTGSTGSSETAGASTGETSGNGTDTASATGSPDGATASTDATTDASGGETTVAAGPDGRLVFEPAQVEVSVGDTVVWEFESPGHNVSGVPKDSEEVTMPQGAASFASYESGDLYAVVDEGETYEHTFETPGEYTYVCIPHVASGMVGTITVAE